MKKASKLALKVPAGKASATKQSTAKPKAKASSKPKPRKAQGQAELLTIVERLAQSAEKLVQAAERLTEATAHLQQGAPGAEGTGAEGQRTNPGDDEAVSPDWPTVHR